MYEVAKFISLADIQRPEVFALFTFVDDAEELARKVSVGRTLMQDAVVEESCQPLSELSEWYEYALLAAHVIVGLLVDQRVINARAAVHAIVKVGRGEDDNLQRFLYLGDSNRQVPRLVGAFLLVQRRLVYFHRESRNISRVQQLLMRCLVDFVGDSLPYLRQFYLVCLDDVGVDGFHFDSQFLRNIEDGLGLFIDSAFVSDLLRPESVVRFDESAVCGEHSSTSKRVDCVLLYVPQLPEVLVLCLGGNLLGLVL